MREQIGIVVGTTKAEVPSRVRFCDWGLVLTSWGLWKFLVISVKDKDATTSQIVMKIKADRSNEPDGVHGRVQQCRSVSAMTALGSLAYVVLVYVVS